MNRKLWLSTLVLALVLVFSVSCGANQGPSSPSTPASSPVMPSGGFTFAGKTIDLIVPSGAGGGLDLTARVYAKILPRYLPGNPAIVVKNMPGGGATIGGNYFYNAKPDGLTLCVGSSTMNIAYTTRQAAVKYDLQKVEVVVSAPQSVFFYIKPGLFDKVENLPNAKGIIWGHRENSPSTWLWVLIMEMTGTPAKLGLGFEGGENRRAFLANEINMSSDGTDLYWEFFDADVKAGKTIILFDSGIINPQGQLVRDPGIPPAVPTGDQLYKTVTGKSPSGDLWEAYIKVVGTARTVQNPIYTSPGTPREIVRAYWDAAAKMVKDSEFRKLTDPKVGEPLPWTVGEAASSALKKTLYMDEKLLNTLRDVLKKHGISVF